jgi:hypothetical protein
MFLGCGQIKLLRCLNITLQLVEVWLRQSTFNLLHGGVQININNIGLVISYLCGDMTYLLGANRAKSYLQMEDGAICTIKDGNRGSVIFAILMTCE